MKLSKKHILLGIICLISAILRASSIVSAVIPYLAFCLCSLIVGPKGRKAFGIVTALLIGLLGLPLLDFIYSTLMAPFTTTLFANVFFLLVQACFYLGLFILVVSWIRKEKFTFSLITDILTLACIVAYSVIKGAEEFALLNAMKQAIEQGTLIDWLNLMDSGNPFASILSEIAFFVALWCTSIRFIKE